MAKHKVSELEGALLDAAVAKAEGVKWDWPPPYSSLWERGGPIIERERITVAFFVGSPSERAWQAWALGRKVGDMGSTPLVAAMRAYVSSKFGEEVELP